MHKIKVGEFSNPYSQRKKNISPIWSKQPSKNDRDSKSPQAVPKKSVSPMHPASISHFEAIDNYRKIQKLSLGKEYMEKIRYYLKIEEQSKKQYELRKKTNNYYFKYEKKIVKDHRRSLQDESLLKRHQKGKTHDEDMGFESNIAIGKALSDLRDKNIVQ